jgi:hypothetical protein
MSEEVEETQAPEATVSLNDFVVMIKVIDICSKRGAFEGAELKDVGILRGRLAAFVEANAPAKSDDEGEQEEEAPAEA